MRDSCHVDMLKLVSNIKCFFVVLKITSKLNHNIHKIRSRYLAGRISSTAGYLEYLAGSCWILDLISSMKCIRCAVVNMHFFLSVDQILL